MLLSLARFTVWHLDRLKLRTAKEHVPHKSHFLLGLYEEL